MNSNSPVHCTRLLSFNEPDVLKLLLKLYRALTEENICTNTERVKECTASQMQTRSTRTLKPPSQNCYK